MTNFQRIQCMTKKQLAEFNVKYVMDADVDYDSDDESFISTTYVYQTSDGSKFYDEDDAIEHEIYWLKQTADLEGGDDYDADCSYLA